MPWKLSRENSIYYLKRDRSYLGRFYYFFTSRFKILGPSTLSLSPKEISFQSKIGWNLRRLCIKWKLAKLQSYLVHRIPIINIFTILHILWPDSISRPISSNFCTHICRDYANRPRRQGTHFPITTRLHSDAVFQLISFWLKWNFSLHFIVAFSTSMYIDYGVFQCRNQGDQMSLRKNSPKCSQTHFLNINLYLRKKYPQNLRTLLYF
jgi:hypothetical protein